MKFQGIIFDLDGVICFTDEYHYLAWKAIADTIGVAFDRSVNNQLRGVSRMASLNIILEKSTKVYSDAEKADLAQKKNCLYLEYLKQMSPRDLSDDVCNTLNALRKNGHKLAIGSSSKNAPVILERLGLRGFFDAESDGNMITHSKPDPEVFLTAARLLNLEPTECLVVEDAVSGATAGHRGGFPVACIGDAAKAGAGDYNMDSITELLEIVKKQS